MGPWNAPTSAGMVVDGLHALMSTFEFAISMACPAASMVHDGDGIIGVQPAR